MTRNQALTVADDAIVSALAAVGEMMPARVRIQLIAASNWCWQRRLEQVPHSEFAPAKDRNCPSTETPMLKDIADVGKLRAPTSISLRQYQE